MTRPRASGRLVAYMGPLMNRYGYCCINLTLGAANITTNRTMRQATFIQRGLPYVSSVALQNCRDLLKIIQWNVENNINVFRISSELFPWASEYEFTDLPDFEEISKVLAEAGTLATKSNQRLSFHPGPFNCLASGNAKVVQKTIKELRFHSEIMDMLLQPRTPQAKINIHVGGSYGNAERTAEVWCNNFFLLPESVRSRLTVENDDKSAGYSTKMLYDWIYNRVGVPIVFDAHHFELGPQDTDYETAIKLAVSTWPEGIRPMFHYSNSRRLEDKSATKAAHSDYYYKRLDTLGYSVDVALECKAKELGLQRYLKQFETTKAARFLACILGG